MLVLGILASIAVVRYRKLKEKAYIGMMTNDLGILRIAEEAYWAEHQAYTVDQTLLDAKPSSEVTLTVTTDDALAGFDAQATHALAPALLCKMYVGRSVSGMPSGQVECQ
jgi:hypothetical protein